jgi:hypothetical protein
VRLHSVFLRKGCVLPNRLDPDREPVGDCWTRLEDLDAPVFDTMVRQAGWHFMWIEDSCARRGFGNSRESATASALTHALGGIARRFNAAELDSVQVASYLGFHMATVTLQPRQVQQQTSLDYTDEI